MWFKLRKVKNRGIIIKTFLKCHTFNIMLINITWQAKKCNLLWKESAQCSKPDQMRSISRRYDVSVARCCIFIPILWSNKRKKKKIFSVGRSSCGKRNRPPASNTRTCPRARLGSAFEKRGDRTGWRARWNLHLRDARRMYSMCRRCQTVKRLWDKPGVSRCP